LNSPTDSTRQLIETFKLANTVKPRLFEEVFRIHSHHL